MAETLTAPEALLAAARDAGDALAFTANGEAVSYAALAADAAWLAARIRRRIGPGDRCVIMLPTSLDFIRAVFAVQMAGGVPVAIAHDSPLPAARRRAALVRAALAVCEPAAAMMLAGSGEPFPCRLATIEELRGDGGVPGETLRPRPEDPAFFQLTSGTTGEPRAAIVSHRSLMASLEATSQHLGFSARDVFATWVPLHYSLGLVRYVFGAVVARCPSHLIRPSMTQLRPWLELVARSKATITGAPDSAYRLAARTVDPSGLDLRALRFAGNGGETVTTAAIEQFERRFGLPGVVRPSYGLAEATLAVTSVPAGDDVLVDESGLPSCGRPIPGIEIKIAGDESPGEIVVRGVPVFDGYFDDPAATAAALRDGWLHTGDLGCIERGHLFIKGRRRVLIKRAGTCIAPREIEDAVERVAGVGASAAVGVSGHGASGTEDVVVVAEVDAQAGERGTDAIVSAIMRETRQALGWMPSRILVVPPRTLPRTATGKMQYDEVRRLVAAWPRGAG